MADEYQITLKGKIKILYQLEKLQDVIKLCEEYNKKYGKDVEVDMMRFKSERRLKKTLADEGNKAPSINPESQNQNKPKSLHILEIAAEEEQPLLLTADHVVGNPAILIEKEIPAKDQLPLIETKPADEPDSKINELVITDSLIEATPGFNQDSKELAPKTNEMIITEPFAENEPVFDLAYNEPPVILVGNEQGENISIGTEPKIEEMSIVEGSPSELAGNSISSDFKRDAVLAFDAEPTLASPTIPEEPISIQINEDEKNLPVELFGSDSAVVGEPVHALDEESSSNIKEIVPEPKSEPAALHINERQKTATAESLLAMADEKIQPVTEPGNIFIKKAICPSNKTFNFKYLLILILPLVAAVILWLALSGKFSFDGNGVDGVSPASVVKHHEPVVQNPVQTFTPAIQTPKIDEKEKSVNEMINQANNFIKNNDILKALAVVLEAKKIKTTEQLLLLEEQITKKIRDDEAKAVEQAQTVQSTVQTEEQAYESAENENTLAGWQKFLMQYPQSEFAAQARKKINILEKQAQKDFELQLQQKVQREQKVKLRSDYINLNQTELDTVLQQLVKIPVQFEQIEHGSEKLVIDYASGLMWTLWNKPMVFEKAQWWANRIYAGYSGWRLPTVEESLSLSQIEAVRYSGLADFVVWTGDAVGDQAHTTWVLKLPESKFIAADNSQDHYVWAVRKIIK